MKWVGHVGVSVRKQSEKTAGNQDPNEAVQQKVFKYRALLIRVLVEN